jgi:hypothetical protein
LYINETNTDTSIPPLFFSFTEDSWLVSSHGNDVTRFTLDYKSNIILAKNDSIALKIIPSNFGYTILDDSSSKVADDEVVVFPMQTNYKNTKEIFGYWKSTDMYYLDESWLYINETIEVSYVDNELFEYFIDSGTTNFPKGEILKLHENYFVEFLSDNYNQKTFLIDYISDDIIQIFNFEMGLKNYTHYKRTNFEYLHKELKEIVLKNEKNPTRFNYKGGEGLKIIVSDHEEEETIPVKIVPIKVE